MHYDIQLVQYPLPMLLSYRSEAPLAPGTRVIVPLKNKDYLGLVWGPSPSIDPRLSEKIKPVTEVVDTEPFLGHSLICLADWLSRYYMADLSQVLKAMLPAQIKNRHEGLYHLSAAGKKHLLEEPEDEPYVIALRSLFKVKDTLSRATARTKERALLAANTAAVKIQDLLELRLIEFEPLKPRIRRGQTEAAALAPTALEATGGLKPNPDQTAAIKTIVQTALRPGPKKPLLLWGVTGSGKTEVFLQAITEILNQDSEAQALLLVPEIALGPQLFRSFSARFGSKNLGFVHSGLSENERFETLDDARTGRIRILIGSRSAVFAPFRSLKVIVVDEEHEESYKQDSHFLYHGRDVAVVRARLEEATIVLASATPSMESLHNAKQGKYTLIELPTRAQGQELPPVQLLCPPPGIGRAPKKKPKGLGELDSRLIEALRNCAQAGGQAVIVLNRRGYARHLHDLSTGRGVFCPNCQVGLSVYKGLDQLICHYCDFKRSLSSYFAEDGRYTLMQGMGTERASELLRAALPELRIAQIDTDTIKNAEELNAQFLAFQRGELDILIGTKMLAKGHDFPNVTLTAILEIDSSLSALDFRARERSMQLLLQTAGRAGRGLKPGVVLIETRHPEQRLLQEAQEHNYKLFAERELAWREALGLAPTRRLILVEFSSRSLAKLDSYTAAFADQFYKALEQLNDPSIHVSGPVPPVRDKLIARYRKTMLLRHQEGGALRELLKASLKAAPPPHQVRVTIDVDPLNLG